MTVVKLGKKGQLSIPKAILDRLGVEGDQMLLVDIADDGAIVLRPTGIYPIEIYSDERISEFLDEDALPADLDERARKVLADRGGST